MQNIAFSRRRFTGDVAAVQRVKAKRPSAELRLRGSGGGTSTTTTTTTTSARVTASVQRLEDGHWSLTFVPRAPGAYELHVALDG